MITNSRELLLDEREGHDYNPWSRAGIHLPRISCKITSSIKICLNLNG